MALQLNGVKDPLMQRLPVPEKGRSAWNRMSAASIHEYPQEPDLGHSVDLVASAYRGAGATHPFDTLGLDESLKFRKQRCQGVPIPALITASE
jgi:hypothetical protein